MLLIPGNDRIALVLVDLQPVFTDRFNGTLFEERVKQTIEYARAVLPAKRIIHLRANYVGSLMRPFSQVLNPSLPVPSDTAACSWSKELDEECVIIKSTINGFHETSLTEYLRGEGVETILLSGLLTCCCVHETAIGGLNRGFAPVIIEDACVDKTPEKHTSAISLYKDYLYQTCTLAELQSTMSSR